MPYMTLLLAERKLTATEREISVRPMTASDLTRATQLWLQAYPPAVSAGETQQSVWDDLAAGLTGAYGEPLGRGSLVAVDGQDQLCGVVQTVVDAPWEGAPGGPFVIELFVGMRYRRSGLATRLLEQVCEGAQSAGYGFLSLQVESSNSPAIALYTKVGFGPLERR